MQKSRFALCGLLVGALAIGGAVLVDRAQAQIRGVQGSSAIELVPPITSSVAQTGIAPLPLGKYVKSFQRLMGFVKVTAAPSGGSGAVLDVYYQYSVDNGMTWQDFAHLQVSQQTGTWFIPVSVITAGSTSVPTPSDGALAANTIVQGPIGDMLRIKYSTSYGSSTGNWTFQAFVTPD
jgi:hypothetical protein